MKKIFYLTICLFFLLLIYTLYLKKELDTSNDLAEELNYQIEGLESDLNSKILNANDIKEIEINNERFELLEKELFILKNTRIIEVVFYGMIKGTDFEEQIIEVTSRHPFNSDLDKVKVDITGISKVLDYYRDLRSDYNWCYMESSLKN